MESNIKHKQLFIQFMHTAYFECEVYYPIIRALAREGVTCVVLLINEESTGTNLELEKRQIEDFYRERAVSISDRAEYTEPVCCLQGFEFIYRFTGIRIKIPYGASLYDRSWGMNYESVVGYDYVFVHGKYYKDYLSKFLDARRIMIGGFPRYEEHFINSQKQESDSRQKTILYLPTWQNNAVFPQEHVLTLLSENFEEVWLKPHHVTVRKRILSENVRRLNNILTFTEPSDLTRLLEQRPQVVVDVRSCVVLEALAMGCEVIALASRKDHEWLCIGENAFIVDMLHVVSDVDELNRLLKILKTTEKKIIDIKILNRRIDMVGGGASDVMVRQITDIILNNKYRKKLFTKLLNLLLPITLCIKWKIEIYNFKLINYHKWCVLKFHRAFMLLKNAFKS